MSVLYAQVIVDIVHENVAHTFTYRIPDGMTLTAGQRVEVPFGRMRKEGVVLSLTQETDVPPEKLRDILRPLEDYAAICPALLTPSPGSVPESSPVRSPHLQCVPAQHNRFPDTLQGLSYRNQK